MQAETKRKTTTEWSLLWLYWRQQAGRGLPGLLILAALAVGTLVLFYGTVVYPIRDRQGALLQQGAGEIVGIVEPRGVSRFDVNRTVVSVRVDGRTAVIRLYQPVLVGQRVQVAYRIGKSGHFYIEKVTPLTETGRQRQQQW